MKFNEKLFNWFFSKFYVYNILWEDSRVDLKYFSLDEQSKLLTISAAGCGVASEVAKNPILIDAVDLNLAHLSIANFKTEAIKYCQNYDEYHHLFTKGKDSFFFKKYPSFIDNLENKEIQLWWKKNKKIITKKGLYTSGLTYYLIQFFHKITRFAPGYWLSLSYEAKLKYFNDFINKIEKLKIFNGKLLTNVSMGISHHQAKLLSREYNSFLDACLNGYKKYAKATLKSPFLYYLIYHKLNSEEETLPPFVQKKYYEQIKNSKTKVKFLHQNIFALLDNTSNDYYTHINLADAIEWMEEDTQKVLLSEVYRVLAPGGELLYRSVVKNNNLIKEYNLEHKFILDEEKSAKASEEDESFLYEKVYFFKKV